MFQQIYNDDDLEDMSNEEGDDEQEHLDEGICDHQYELAMLKLYQTVEPVVPEV